MSYLGRSQYAEKLLDFMNMTILMGDLNKTLIEHTKLGVQAQELVAQMIDLRNSKININEIKNAAKQFEAEQYEKAVRHHAEWDGTFELENDINFTDHFRDTDDYYNNRKITAIHILTGNINAHHNTVKLTIKTMPDRWARNKGETEPKITTEEKKYVKGEKVFEIIKTGGWQVPAKEVAPIG